MRKIILFIVLLMGCVFGKPQNVSVADATAHARNYRFSFVNGNLLPNWSFEEGFYGWEGPRHSKAELMTMTGGKISPVSGSYVGAAFGNHPIISISVPVEGGADYTLSLYVASLSAGTRNPAIYFYSNKMHFLSQINCPNYSYSGSGWAFYSAGVKAPAGARYAKVVLENYGSGILLFDDVILEKGTEPSDRNSVGMSVVFSDALGRTHMTETLVRRGKPNGLIPLEDVRGDVVYGKERVELKARSRAYGGNIESGDYMLLDNDVKVRDPSVADLRVAAKNKIQLGDRDSLHANVFYGNKLNWNHQDYVRHHEKSTVVDAYNLDFGSIDVGSSNVTVNNDKESTLVPGKYKDAMIRARGKLHMSSGVYYFRKFTLEPTAALHLDLSGGDIEIYVKSDLKIYDNTRFRYDSTLTNFIVWRLGQSSTMRFGTDSKLAGVFVAPNARVELGHRSYLRGAIYAREVAILEDSKIKAPSFIFDAGRNLNALGGAKLFAVTENRYDLSWRNYRTDKTYVAELDSEGYVRYSEQNANNYYSVNGDGPDAGDFAFYEKAFSTKDGHVLKSSIPGYPWRAFGPHSGNSYEVFVPDLSIPASLNFSNHAGDSVYVLSATEDAEWHVSLSWKNRLGQLVQEAYALDTVGSDMRNWNWAIKRYEYTREGRIRRVLTPLDTKSGDSLFAVVSEYDIDGRVISRFSPNVGREMFFYGTTGNLRFSQTAEQRYNLRFSYVDYDEQGRVISKGESNLPTVTEDYLNVAARSSSSAPGIKTEYSGRAYDKLSKCTTAIGDSLFSATVSGLTPSNTRGRLVCSWARNPDLTGFISSSEALVADVFSYDSVGRVSVVYRYTGAERDSTRRLVSKRVIFDDLGKLVKVSIRNAAGSVLSERNFAYDAKGRVSSVRDASGNLLTAYTYDDFGRKKVVDVGSALRAEYGYHLHGQVNSIRVLNPVTSSVLFEQRINFENVDDSIAQPRFDGRISQVKSTTKLLDSTLSDNSVYIYDMMGNLQTKTGTGTAVTFGYDENGRMLSQDYGSSRLDYEYGPGSYAVSRATGHTPMDGGRDASRAGNFRYDSSGRMVHDSSRGISVTYGADGLPAVLLQDSGSGTWRELAVYDPSGWRVATYSYENGSLVSLRTDIMLDGRKELERRTSFAGSGSSVTEYSMLYGSGSVLGRRLADGTSEWYVKDRQGSLVMSVVNNGLGTALVYEPFGFQRLLYASGNEPAEQYTGKEYDGRLGLTYFGARYFDPSFALWLTPDPARQYLNPYSYGGDPVNGVDRDGRFWEKFKNVLTLGALEILSGGMLSTGAGAVAGTAVGLGVGAASLGVGAAVGADALTGGLLGGLLGGMAGIVVATPGGTSLLTSLYANDWEWDSDVANSFLTGVFVDLSGGVIPAAGNMTMMSYAQRCYNDFDNCGFLASDFATGGYFMDNIGHTIGLANAQYFGGTADWYSYGGVSDYYDGNVVYSGGLFGGPLKDAKNGEDFGFAHFGHAVFVSDKNRKDMIAHELTHVRQQERRGFRIGYLVSYLYENDWWIDSDADGYRANPYEMEAYYFQFLYDQGYINMDGSLKDGVVEDHDEWSRIFYEKGYTDSRGDWHQAYRDWKGVEARYEKHWTWEGDWSFYETP